MRAQERGTAEVDAGLYAPDATERTYTRALSLAETVVAAGRVAIVDGAFLKRWQRELFRARAEELGLPFAIVAFAAPEAALRTRVALRAARATDASDADLAVLDHQLRTQEPLSPVERACTIDVDAATPLDRAGDAAAWHAVLAWLGAARPRQA